MSSIYKGIWPIKDVDLDFIIEFDSDSDETEIDGQNVKVCFCCYFIKLYLLLLRS